MGKIDFYYLKELLKEQYYLPVFKCDIYLANKFFQDNSTKKRAIGFLNNIFECFDGLTEKEYLIDIDNNLFYKNGFFSSKKYLNYDFRDLEDIRKKFEKKGGIKMLEEFITKLKTGDFILMKKRLDYIDNLNMYTYTKYKEKLEIFFNLLR